MQQLSYSVMDTGGDSTLCFIDLTTGESGNVPQWNKKEEDIKTKVMDIITNPGDSENPVKDIYNIIIGSQDMTIRNIRKELGVEVSDSDGKITIGDVVLPARFQKLLSTVDTKEEAQSIVAFAKDLANNPAQHCHEALIEWLLANPSLSFTSDGRVIGYRAVHEDFSSNHSGYGIVNGVEYKDAHLDNSPGNVLEYPRFMVDANPSKYCSVGLHVGTWDYAAHYLSGNDVHRISVAFRASDVVSPPSDAQQEKIRVSKYTVLEEITAPYEDTIIDDSQFSSHNDSGEE